jgi:hypothetical protein
LRRVFDPKFANEGDIHVWPDDHIDWGQIKQAMADDFEIVLEQDYLLYQQLYRRQVYDRYSDRCSDTKVMIFRKRAA